MIVRTLQLAALVGVDEEEDEDGEDDDELVVVGADVEDVLEVGGEPDVVETSSEPGVDGATATGRSLTWLSASATICQVRAVVTTRTTTHPATSFQEVMATLSQALTHEWIKGLSRNPQDRPGSPRRR